MSCSALRLVDLKLNRTNIPTTTPKAKVKAANPFSFEWRTMLLQASDF